MKLLLIASICWCVWCLTVPQASHYVTAKHETRCEVSKRYSDGSSLKIAKCSDHSYTRKERMQMTALVEREVTNVKLYSQKGELVK